MRIELDCQPISLPPGGRGTTEVVEGARAISVYRLFYPYRITVYKNPSRPCGRLSLLTKCLKKHSHSNMHKKQNTMFALAMQGWRGRSPLQKKRCHPEAASADRLAAEGSRAAPIYKRGAEPARGDLMRITVKLESKVVVCTFIRQNNKITV